ncbi:hypothetical protein HYDPIDRAFT_26977 [Hydnomerulius pinastri MD-312]|nr:hypothetical protein HYDPIDRAFT_26977 [Hydnomerulius pinastri MD-312]
MHDAHLLYHQPPTVFTTPNAYNIPRLFHWEDEDTQARADGRFGYVDLHQWPQMYEKSYPWSVAIPRKHAWTAGQPMSWMWYTLAHEDFVPLPNSNLAIRFLVTPKLEGLKTVHDFVLACFRQYQLSITRLSHDANLATGTVRSMQVAYDHLHQFPLAWHNTVAMVAEYQQNILEACTVMDYHENIKPHMRIPTHPYPDANLGWMGAFTQHEQIADRLFAAGVPVWLICPDSVVLPDRITVQAIVDHMVQPTDIVTAQFQDPRQAFATPFPVRYHSPGGLNCHIQVRLYQFAADMQAVEEEQRQSEAGPSWQGRNPSELLPGILTPA